MAKEMLRHCKVHRNKNFNVSAEYREHNRFVYGHHDKNRNMTAQEPRFRAKSLASRITSDQKNYVSPSVKPNKIINANKLNKNKPLESTQATPQFLGARCATADFAAGPAMKAIP